MKPDDAVCRSIRFEREKEILGKTRWDVGGRGRDGRKWTRRCLLNTSVGQWRRQQQQQQQQQQPETSRVSHWDSWGPVSCHPRPTPHRPNRCVSGSWPLLSPSIWTDVITFPSLKLQVDRRRVRGRIRRPPHVPLIEKWNRRMYLARLNNSRLGGGGQRTR